MPDKRILIVEDEEDIVELVSYNLGKAGYDYDCVTSGEEAIKSIRKEIPQLVLLDLMLPGVDGLDVCRIIKNDPVTKDVPVIMLTAKGEESDIVKGLNLGADDYVTKPFSPKILMARIATVLRRVPRGKSSDDECVRIHDISIHPGRHEVRVAEDLVDMTYTEFRILQFLARRPGWVFTRNQIVEAVHGEDYSVTDRSVDVQIVGLRKKLGHAGEYIQTVRGVGYRFRE